MDQPHITPEIVEDVDRRRVVVLILGLVCFLVVANVTSVVVLEHRPVNRSNWLVREKWRLLDRSPPVDTVVLGDSSCTQAVRPDVLEAELGGHSLNLCTVGNMLAVNDVWMLDEYIRRHGKPKRVLIVHVYHAWNRHVDGAFAQLLGKIDRPWSFWSDMNPRVALSRTRTADVAVSRWLPLYGEHKSLQRHVQTLWSDPPPRFSLHPTGFMRVETASPARVRRDFENHVRQLADVTAATALSEDNRRALVRLRELATLHDLDVAILPAPIYEELWRTPAVQERVRWVHAAIARTLGSSRNIHIVTTPAPTFAANEMENVDHVVGEAAVRYTRWMLTVLATDRARN
jgi:hypothetical protein